MNKFFYNYAIFFSLIFTVSLLVHSSCTNKADSVPSKIISKDRMVDVLVDVHLAEASADNHGLKMPQINMVMAAKYDSLFKKHETTFSQFKSSYDYYLNHASELAEIYAEVVNKLTTMETKISGGRNIPHPPVQKRDSLPLSHPLPND